MHYLALDCYYEWWVVFIYSLLMKFWRIIFSSKSQQLLAAVEYFQRKNYSYLWCIASHFVEVLSNWARDCYKLVFVQLSFYWQEKMYEMEVNAHVLVNYAWEASEIIKFSEATESSHYFDMRLERVAWLS